MRRLRIVFVGGLTPRSRQTGGTFRPQLTSLVDVMTILLVFLLKSFSVEGKIVTPSHDLELPVSSSTTPPSPMMTLEITRQAVSSEGTVIAPIATFMNQDSLLVQPLYTWVRMVRARAADTLTSRRVLIQADRSIPFSIVKRVMYTCSRAGIADFTVLVQEQQ